MQFTFMIVERNVDRVQIVVRTWEYRRRLKRTTPEAGKTPGRKNPPVARPSFDRPGEPYTTTTTTTTRVRRFLYTVRTDFSSVLRRQHCMRHPGTTRRPSIVRGTPYLDASSCVAYARRSGVWFDNFVFNRGGVLQTSVSFRQILVCVFLPNRECAFEHHKRFTNLK